MNILSKSIKRVLDTDAALRLTEILDRRSENRITEFGMIAHAMEFAKINAVPGDYFEFGLWRGKTFLHAHRLRRRYGHRDMKLLGFDSFQGLPAHENDRDNIWSKGQFAHARPDLERMLARNGVPSTSYALIEGFYQDSLNDELIAKFKATSVKASIAYIDCDLYESTIPVLRFLRHFIQNGTILCFDDYFNYKGSPDQGEARALQEFCAENPELRLIPYLIYAPLGNSFIVRIND